MDDVAIHGEVRTGDLVDRADDKDPVPLPPVPWLHDPIGGLPEHGGVQLMEIIGKNPARKGVVGRTLVSGQDLLHGLAHGILPPEDVPEPRDRAEPLPLA